LLNEPVNKVIDPFRKYFNRIMVITEVTLLIILIEFYNRNTPPSALKEAVRRGGLR
jgi:hypothetical protein